MKEGRKTLVHSQHSGEEQRTLLLMFPAVAVQGVLCTQYHNSSPYHTSGREQAAKDLVFLLCLQLPPSV